MRSTILTSLALVLCTSTIAGAASIEPVAQNRRTFGDAISIGADGNIQDIDEHVSEDFARFSDVLITASQSGTAESTVESWQDSIIGSCGLVAAGGFVATTSIGPDAMHAYAIGFSGYAVDFDVDVAMPFEIAGAFDLDGQTHARIELRHDGTALINDLIQAQTGTYEAGGTLQPGRYRLSFHVFGTADTLEVHSDVRDAHFRLQLRVCGPQQDINGDGAVDVFDLVMLLQDWGACPGSQGGDCLADLDFNHVVDVFDLVELLTNWGS